MTNKEKLELPDEDEVQRIIAAALAEDIGTGDITSQLLIPENVTAEMQFIAHEELITCGTFIPALVYAQLKADVEIEIYAAEGESLGSGDPLLKVTGPARAIITGERVTLNIMQRMCGVARLTHDYVEAVVGTNAVILDTRKTMPCLRTLDKYAVRAGGGSNYRMGLYDMVMIKDNHLALVDGIAGAVYTVRAGTKLAIEVECDTIEQVMEALAARPDRILLDNMEIEDMRRVVTLVAGSIPLEASGGVSLDNVREIAETGVDYISVGKLTHSAPSSDIGADITLPNMQ